MFGAKGDKPGEFLRPSWIHVDGEYVYVTVVAMFLCLMCQVSLSIGLELIF